MYCQEAYDKGQAAGFNGLALNTNPYPAKSDANQAWADGWASGRREYDVALEITDYLNESEFGT